MRRILTVTSLLVLVAAACTDSAAYKDQTEDFLNDDSTVETAVGGDVSGAECVEPESTDVGSTYQCTADVASVGNLTFDVTIDAKDSFAVTDFNPS